MRKDGLVELRLLDPSAQVEDYSEGEIRRNIVAITGPAGVDAQDHFPRTSPAIHGIQVREGRPLRNSGIRRRAATVVVTALTAAAIVLVATSVVASHRPQSESPAGSLTQFRDTQSGLSFDYPSSWSQLVPSVQPTAYTQLVWLSSSSFRDPCFSASAPDGSVSQGCSNPDVSLEDGGVFISWTYGNLPGSNADFAPSRKVGGFDAQVEESAPSAECANLAGAMTELKAVIAYPSIEQSTRMSACIGPDPDGKDLRTLNMLLDSAKFDA